jgi:hypothetical protein
MSQPPSANESSPSSPVAPSPALRAWLKERLGGERGRADWGKLVEAGYDALLGIPLEVLVPAAELDALVDAIVRPEVLVEVVRAWTRHGAPFAVAEMKTQVQPLSRRVPPEAEAALLALVSRPGFVHADWIRALFQEAAIEDMLRDTLYRALRDFSTIVPRLIMNLLPKSRIPMLGSAGVLGTRLMEELERLLEPEIKAFLAGGTKRALERAADYSVQHSDDPSSVELRKNVVRFILGKSPAFHALPLTEPALADIDTATAAIARRIGELDEVKREVKALLGRLRKLHGNKTLGAVLGELGITHRPPLGAWAAVSWPAIARSLEAAPISAWLEGLADEIAVALDRSGPDVPMKRHDSAVADAASRADDPPAA